MNIAPTETASATPTLAPRAPDTQAIAAYARSAGQRRGLTDGELAEDIDDTFGAVTGAYAALPVLQTLIDGFAGSRHRIHVTCDPDLRRPAAELAAMGMVVAEAVSNALAHAFPADRTGDIWVRLSDDNGRVTLRIRDNGVGMPDLDHAPGSGRGLIEALSRQLGGYARLGSVPFGGAEVSIIIPHAA